MTARALALLFALLLPAAADTLILKDGTHVTGRWWSLDATHLHFLVNNQLQHYPRSDVAAVTFGDATLPQPPPAPAAQRSGSVAPPAPAAQRPGSMAPPAPAAQRSGSVAPPAPAAQRPGSMAPPAPAAQRSGSVAPPAPVPTRGPSEPEETGVVYFRNGSGDLTPLERNQAAERRHGATQYWEMPAARSRIRVKAAPELAFVVRLAKGADPATFSLYPLVTVNGSRRTQPQPGRRGALLTWPFEVTKMSGSLYTFTVKDLPTGEYSFSPSSSNDGYCFGVDASASGQ